MKRRGRLERTGAVAVKAPARVDAHQPAAVRRLLQQRLAARVQRPQQRVVCQPHERLRARRGDAAAGQPGVGERLICRRPRPRPRPHRAGPRAK